MSTVKPTQLVPILRQLGINNLDELQQALTSDTDSKSPDGSAGHVLRTALSSDNAGLLNGHWSAIQTAFQLIQSNARAAESESSSSVTGPHIFDGGSDSGIDSPGEKTVVDEQTLVQTPSLGLVAGEDQPATEVVTEQAAAEVVTEQAGADVITGQPRADVVVGESKETDSIPRQRTAAELEIEEHAKLGLGGTSGSAGANNLGGGDGDPVKLSLGLKKGVEKEILSGYTDIQIPNFAKDKVDIVQREGKVYATLKSDLDDSLLFDGIKGKDSEGKNKNIELEISQSSASSMPTIIKGVAIALGLIGALVAGTSSEGGKGWLGVLGGFLATAGALAFKPVRDLLFFFDKPENK